MASSSVAMSPLSPSFPGKGNICMSWTDGAMDADGQSGQAYRCAWCHVRSLPSSGGVPGKRGTARVKSR